MSTARFTTQISAESIKSYLDTVILLSTFMFAFSTSYLTAFAPDDISGRDEKWYFWCKAALSSNTSVHSRLLSADGSSGWCHGLDLSVDMDTAFSTWPELPSRALGRRIIYTYSALGAAVLLSILSYLSFLFSEPACFSKEVLRSWWCA